MSAALTLEILLEGRWQKAARLEFPDEASGERGQCFFEYEHAYLEAWIDSRRPDAAASLTLPLDFGPVIRRRWPALLDDLRPMGSGRRWWLQRLRLEDAPTSDFRLLREGTVAPVGNLRIAEAVPPREGTPRRFDAAAVVDRESDFIEWAVAHGAQVGGATGAGGDSPKVLLRKDLDGKVWIDAWQDAPDDPATHFLVKFARGRDERDRTILRSEYVYYRALEHLGIPTISTKGMELREGQNGPSLWLPRFDVRRQKGREVRLGVESVYSLLDAQPGARLRHQDVLAALRREFPKAEWPRVLVDYVQRDLLNLIFGNSDNHGRNTALLKSSTDLRLAPVYDFAPMKMDPEGIARSTYWGEFEGGGDVDWHRLLPSFEEHEKKVRDHLRGLARRLVGLPQLLQALGLPAETLEFPSLGLRKTEDRLRAWGLL